MIGDIPAVVTLSKTGDTVLAPERFANATELRQVCQQMILDDRPRSSERSMVDRVANGNPTYSLAALKAKKQGWRGRTNYRGMEGLLQQMGNTFYDLNVEIDPVVRIFLDYGKGQDREDWQECIAARYTKMILQQWPAFDFHVPMRDNQMLRHGMGAHVWPVKGKWEPRTPTMGHVLFPEETSVDFYNQGESFMLREFTPAHVLYNYIRNEKAATKAKWDVKAVWKTLEMMSKAQRGMYQTNDPEEFQKSLKSSDYGTSMSRQAGVWLNYFFIVELESRKISQYIIPEDLGVPDYLFKDRNRFDDFDEVLCLFPYEIPSTGVLHGIRGFGARTREHFEMLNRVNNAMVDNVMLSMYPQFQQNGAVDPDKMRLMRIGAMTIYPQGITPSVLNLPNLAQTGIPLSQMLNESINQNNQTYLSGTPEPKDRETALSFQMRAQDMGRVSKATYSLYHRNQTRFHNKVLRTALMPATSNEPWAVMAREFRQGCLDDGVPAAALNRIVNIEAQRSVGTGSAANRLQALSMIRDFIYPTTTEDRKIAIERDFTAAVSGYSQVDRYARNAKDQEIPNNDDSIIALENDALSNGGNAVANSYQDNVKHSQGHLQAAAQIVQAVQQGQMDPQKGYNALHAMGQHIAEHLQMLEGNPLRKQEFDALHREWLALSKVADQLLQHITESQDSQQQPPEEQISDNLKIGLAKVQSSAQIKEQKFAHDSSLKERQFALNNRLKFGQAAANTRIKAVQTAAQIQQKNRLALTNGASK